MSLRSLLLILVLISVSISIPVVLATSNIDDLTTNRLKNIEMSEQRLTKPNLQIARESPSGFKLKQAMPREGCIELNQAFFNGQTGGVSFIYASGCVELTEDIYFPYSINVADGSDGFYFTCNNHKIRGNHGNFAIRLFDEATVKNCKVVNAGIGFMLYDNTTVLDSIAENNSQGFYTAQGPYSTYIFGSRAQDNRYEGFNVREGSFVESSFSNNNGVSGFVVQENGRVLNSHSYENGANGFFMWDTSQCIECESWGNIDNGFYLEDSAKVFSSLALSNYDWGFKMFTDSKVEDSSAVRNEEDGFILYDNASVSGSTSNNNDYWGFWQQGWSSVEDSIATNNGGDGNINMIGFVLQHNSRASGVTARNNGRAGFHISGNSQLTNGIAINHNNGFEMYNNASVNQSIALSNHFHGYKLFDSTQLTNSIARYNGEAQGDYGIQLQGFSVASNILSDTNENGVYVDTGARLLEGYRVCNNDNNNIYVNGGYVEGRFQTGQIAGAGNWQNAVIVPCGGGGGGSSPLFLKPTRQETIGLSPKGNDWTVIVIAAIAMILVFVIYRNFSAYRINRNRINNKRRR